MKNMSGPENAGAVEFSEYPHARHLTADGKYVTMVRAADADYLLAADGLGFSGTTCERGVLAPLNHENAVLLRKLFAFTAPLPVLRKKRSIGLGDRLGLAAPGQLRAVVEYDAYPILAQQSVRELTLTGRSFEEVLDDASFAAFREDFQRGFGADGDHLKKPEEIDQALSIGYTMITLDCSEHISNEAAQLSDEEVLARYQPDAALEEKYIGKDFAVSPELTLHFGAEDFRRMVLIYGEAIEFITKVYADHIRNRDVDFEISIDETMTPTTPLQHFFVAKELTDRGIHFVTMAPHFCGEFQKGVDYIGNLKQFDAELVEHVAIAEHFGYKISVHSGSDKFSIFPSVGRITKGHFHLKTAGTNWLEAMKLVSIKDPALYREIHAFALEAFSEATKYYHVTTDLSRIPDLSTLRDEQLPELFGQNDARQLIHITYGLILQAKNEDGSSRFRTRLYKLWREYDEDYAEMLHAHIGHHLRQLYSQIPQQAL